VKSNEELYSFKEELINRLEDQRDFAVASRLRDAMSISSVVTEVFMTLRHELAEVLDSTIELDPDTRDKDREAISAIGRALR
jgi:hypothetical protein